MSNTDDMSISIKISIENVCITEFINRNRILIIIQITKIFFYNKYYKYLKRILSNMSKENLLLVDKIITKIFQLKDF